MYQWITRLSIASFLYLFSSAVWAGTPPVGSITYALVAAPPPPVAAAPVPTLSGVMFMIMALLLAAVAYRVLKQKQNSSSRMMVLSLIAVGSLASGMSGVKLINDAYAFIPTSVTGVSNPGTTTLYGGFNRLENIGEADLEITDITLNNGIACVPIESAPQCLVDGVIISGSSCSLSCFDL